MKEQLLRKASARLILQSTTHTCLQSFWPVKTAVATKDFSHHSTAVIISRMNSSGDV